LSEQCRVKLTAGRVKSQGGVDGIADVGIGVKRTRSIYTRHQKVELDRPRHSSSEVRCKQRRSSPEPSAQPPSRSPRHESRNDKVRRETPRSDGCVHHRPPDQRADLA